MNRIIQDGGVNSDGENDGINHVILEYWLAASFYFFIIGWD